ncbi:hypothetical protein SISNIDRAFT_469075 [Sistotremastrum niveocremeum HHB9708]|uniref:Uncharacterized protein n=1 Tax=Sistotremastrum niveocremeum HHB9708 TaxID=1314777 RepID=A0A164QNP3_9AGAM|nr:hypothetical protein SISNIDRAFT_469075 [Sistotremastrum niveocremeum HHB9708]
MQLVAVLGYSGSTIVQQALNRIRALSERARRHRDHTAASTCQFREMSRKCTSSVLATVKDRDSSDSRDDRPTNPKLVDSTVAYSTTLSNPMPPTSELPMFDIVHATTHGNILFNISHQPAKPFDPDVLPRRRWLWTLNTEPLRISERLRLRRPTTNP